MTSPATHNRGHGASPSRAAELRSSPSLSLQQVIDQAAILNLFAIPGNCDSTKQHHSEIHQLELEMAQPTKPEGVRCANRLSGSVGQMEYRLVAIPHSWKVLPNSHLASIPFDRAISQRFAIQQCRISIGPAGQFSCFGSGRTFPMRVGGRSRLMAAALLEITSGSGAFHQLEGNLAWCGILTQRNAFCGHIIARFVDERAVLRVSSLPQGQRACKPLRMGLTFLSFIGQKGDSPDQVNRFSTRADGTPRGLNISTMLKQASVAFATNGRLQVQELRTGDVIGKEIGFGPLPAPETPPQGLPLRPFPFEGVAKYRFSDRNGESVGAITTNVTEGRRVDVRFGQVPGQVGYRFGFFGPVVYGTGCFQGVQGLFYGASASFLSPPPGQHVVTHFYAAMLHDRDGKFRQ